MKELKIYIDRLKHDQTFKLDEILSPDFMQVDEADLSFATPLHVKAEAYLADEHLVIHLDVEASATLPCSICNHPVITPIHIKNLYLTKPLAEMKGAICDLAEEIRETVLLQTPLFIECAQGQCPERESINRFFKKGEVSQDNTSSVNFPFADL